MIFLFQFLPLLLPLNQTFLCHNGSGPISIHATSRILDVEIEEDGLSLHRKNEILVGLLAKFPRRRGNQESCVSEYITYRKVG